MFRCKGVIIQEGKLRRLILRELAHAMVGVLHIQNLQDGWQAKDLGKLQLDSKAIYCSNSSLFMGEQSLFI